jgi:hypothetical protein
MTMVRSRSSQFNRRKVSLAQPPTTEYVQFASIALGGTNHYWDCETLSQIVYQGVKLPNGYYTCDFQNEFGNLVAEGMLILPDPGAPQTKFRIASWSVPCPFQPTTEQIAVIMGGVNVVFGSGDNLTIPSRSLCIRSPSGGYLVGGVFPVGE